MRFLSTLVLGLLASSPALAICNQAKPPSQFLGEPRVAYRIASADDTGIYSKCGASPNAGEGMTLILHGCTRQTGARSFTIYVRSSANSGERACIVQHEKAHLRGWSPNHGNSAGRPKWKIDPNYSGPNPMRFGDL